MCSNAKNSCLIIAIVIFLLDAFLYVPVILIFDTLRRLFGDLSLSSRIFIGTASGSSTLGEYCIRGRQIIVFRASFKSRAHSHTRTLTCSSLICIEPSSSLQSKLRPYQSISVKCSAPQYR